ncbi:hypothetical protein AQPE_0116 [Aquipluma nitroreducens]|uniref:Uncharacterized protein n=1 Tax=Aquipluma nitroreducens TaxID=2010828 RepID=A0A5K7S3C5_9BACT|nr:hypothetical protein AQPE_0116 [Aquipluma nitroreducens]
MSFYCRLANVRCILISEPLPFSQKPNNQPYFVSILINISWPIEKKY